MPTLERIAELTYEGPIEVVLADNDSTDRTGRSRPPKRQSGSGLTTGGLSSRSRASIKRSTPHWRP